MQVLQRSPGEEYVYNLRKDAENIGIQKGIRIGFKKGFKKGFRIGIEKGIRIGIEKGIGIGFEKENMLIGKMINDKSDREISDFLEIPIERVIQYRKDNDLT